MARSKEEIIWIAGYFEGEGYVEVARDPRKTGNSSPRITLNVRATDYDVLKRLHYLTPGSRLRGPYKSCQKKHYKDAWDWQLARGDAVAYLLAELIPHMGERRASRMREALQALASSPGSGHNQYTGSDYEGRSVARKIAQELLQQQSEA